MPWCKMLSSQFVHLTGAMLALLMPTSLAAEMPLRYSMTPLPIADRVVVYKAERQMSLLQQGRVLKTYRIALGGNPVGHKVRQGDSRTPEGSYILDWRNPNSAFFLSLHISYPNEADRERAARLGVPPGGAIMIHGQSNDASNSSGRKRSRRDWTDGCIAVSNSEMLEIWEAVPDGTPIDIYP